jgi:hypothetical protein
VANRPAWLSRPAPHEVSATRRQLSVRISPFLTTARRRQDEPVPEVAEATLIVREHASYGAGVSAELLAARAWRKPYEVGPVELTGWLIGEGLAIERDELLYPTRKGWQIRAAPDRWVPKTRPARLVVTQERQRGLATVVSRAARSTRYEAAVRDQDAATALKVSICS